MPESATKLIDILKCIQCGHAPLAEGENEYKCNNCGRSYGVVRGVPDFVELEQMISGQRDIHEYYENEAGKYNKSHGSDLHGTEYNIRTYYRKVFQRHLSPDLSVVEIGCGTGRFSRLIRESTERLVSTDFSMPMLQQGLGTAPVQVCADSQNLPFRDDRFDVCVGVTTFSYVPDKVKALQSIKQVLKPGGRIILIDMNRKSPIFFFSRLVYGKLRDKNHQEWVLTQSSLDYTSKLLESQGFRIVEGRKLSFVPHVSPPWFTRFFGWADRLFSAIPLSSRYAMRFYVVAEAP